MVAYLISPSSQPPVNAPSGPRAAIAPGSANRKRTFNDGFQGVGSGLGLALRLGCRCGCRRCGLLGTKSCKELVDEWPPVNAPSGPRAAIAPGSANRKRTFNDGFQGEPDHDL
jgi:hypothetical protein